MFCFCCVLWLWCARLTILQTLAFGALGLQRLSGVWLSSCVTAAADSASCLWKERIHPNGQRGWGGVRRRLWHCWVVIREWRRGSRPAWCRGWLPKARLLQTGVVNNCSCGTPEEVARNLAGLLARMSEKAFKLGWVEYRMRMGCGGAVGQFSLVSVIGKASEQTLEK